MKTTLLIPTLNEVESMKVIMPLLRREWCDQILIVDGGSTDGSAEWARASGYEVYVQKNPGLRQCYIEAWPLIQGDVIITFSPDGNSLPEKLPELIAKMKEGYDMVIVSRYLADARSEDDDIVTGFGNFFFTTAINLMFRGRYTDAMVMYRAYLKDTVEQFGILANEHSKIWDKYIGRLVSIEPQLSMRFAKYKAKVAEIPGSEPKRIAGKRKMMPFRTGSAVLFQMMQEFFMSKKTHERN